MARSATIQVLESTSLSPRDNLIQTVERKKRWQSAATTGLYAVSGERKYQNRAERERVLAGFEKLDETRCLFGLLLAWTGARVTEVLSLTAASFQIESGIVTFETLKRRVFSVREVRIPPALMRRVVRLFNLEERQRGDDCLRRLWKFCRQTAWRFVKSVCGRAGIVGRRASPRGLRHAFGVETLSCGVPLTLIQRWMGHARLTTTSIYLSVSGSDELIYAKRFWRGAAHSPADPRAPMSEAA